MSRFCQRTTRKLKSKNASEYDGHCAIIDGIIDVRSRQDAAERRTSEDERLHRGNDADEDETMTTSRREDDDFDLMKIGFLMRIVSYRKGEVLQLR